PDRNLQGSGPAGAVAGSGVRARWADAVFPGTGAVRLAGRGALPDDTGGGQHGDSARERSSALDTEVSRQCVGGTPGNPGAGEPETGRQDRRPDQEVPRLEEAGAAGASPERPAREVPRE